MEWWWWSALAVAVVVVAWRWCREPVRLRLTVARGLTLALLVMAAALLWSRQTQSWLAYSVWAAASLAVLVLSVMEVRRRRRHRYGSLDRRDKGVEREIESRKRDS